MAADEAVSRSDARVKGAGKAVEVAVSAEQYARWRASTLGRTTERLEVALVLDLAGELAGRRVLDVGTGDGTYAIEAAARGASVTALDVSGENLASAKKRAAACGVEVAFRRGRAERLPFGDGSFDRVIAVTVLCFMEEPARAVAEMSRVLVPGGRLILGELGRPSLWASVRRIRGWAG